MRTATATTPDAATDAAGTIAAEGDLIIDVRGRLMRIIRTEPSLIKQARVVRAIPVRLTRGAFIPKPDRDQMIRIFEALVVSEQDVLTLGLTVLQQRRAAAYTALLTPQGRIPWEA